MLLGDIVDMWRRDASGVFLENMETVQIIKDLQVKIRVHWVAGNHDYHLLKLKNRAPHYRYPFEFKRELEIKEVDAPSGSCMATSLSTVMNLRIYEAHSGHPLPLLVRL